MDAALNLQLSIPSFCGKSGPAHPCNIYHYYRIMLQCQKYLAKWPFYITLALLFACTYNDGIRGPLIPKNKNNAAEKANTLFAFVGKKIAVTPRPSPDNSFDAVFEARYQVLQKVYGDYQGDTITFTVYDHYGTPSFERYEHALLFVSKGTHGWYHEKYQYFDVYRTASGRWAGRYNPYEYSDTSKPDAVKPIPIAFPPEAVFPLSVKTWEEGEVEYWFPQPYYKVERDTAFPLYGNYVEDLFELKKRGVLGARGLFDHKQSDLEAVQDIQMAEIERSERIGKKDKRFLSFWDGVCRYIKDSNAMQIKSLLLDSLTVCSKPMAAPDFLQHCYPQLVDDKLKTHLTDTAAVFLGWSILNRQVQPRYLQQALIKDRGQYKKWKATISYHERYMKERECYLQFIETANGFKLFDWKESYDEDCCR